MKNIKFVIILLLVSVIFISGCAQSGGDSTTKEIIAQKKLTIVSYCKSTGEQPPCPAGETPVPVEPTETLPPSLPSSSATPTPSTTTSLPPVLPSSSATPTTSLPPTLTGSSATSDCVVTYTPPKEHWKYGPCTIGQKARLTEVSYSYNGSTCKLSEIIPKTSEPCTSDATTSATPTPSTTTSTSPSPTPTDVNPTPSASASPTPSVPPHIEVSSGIETLIGVYLTGGSLVGATSPCGNSNDIQGIKFKVTSGVYNTMVQNSGNGYAWSMTSDDKPVKGWGSNGQSFSWDNHGDTFDFTAVPAPKATISYEFKMYDRAPTLAQLQANPPLHPGDVGDVVVRLYVKC
ncbi:MAG: hypothetical protein HY512_02670, partial [Candidatus Aenigmarchaeota archaeon]|nr:hypothetical protein [Candidatus Aenigmarchaeota archaeon]